MDRNVNFSFSSDGEDIYLHTDIKIDSVAMPKAKLNVTSKLSKDEYSLMVESVREFSQIFVK